MREELAVHAVGEIGRHPPGEVVAQLAVRGVPEDGDAELAAGPLDDGRGGGGRAGSEGWGAGEGGAVELVEMCAVGGGGV